MVHSFLLIGQSNMSGRGVLTKENSISNPRILRLVNGRWQPMWEPLSADRGKAGASLAPAFALEYLKWLKPEDSVGLIPASDGGSAIEEWQPGQALYDHAVSQARLAMRQSELKAIFWHQGEADCAPEKADKYKDRFLNMFRTIKKDLGLSYIKIYVGALGDYLADNDWDPKLPNYGQVNKALMQLVEENEDIRFVSAQGLTSNDDYLHFNTDSLRELGRRYYKAYAADHPELSEDPSIHDDGSVSPEEQLARHRERLERGELSQEEYQTFIAHYISTL